MAQVYAVCGMPGSGKGEFAAVLSNKGIPVVSMGDMVRAEVRSRELPENPSTVSYTHLRAHETDS